MNPAVQPLERTTYLRNPGFQNWKAPTILPANMSELCEHWYVEHQEPSGTVIRFEPAQKEVGAGLALTLESTPKWIRIWQEVEFKRLEGSRRVLLTVRGRQQGDTSPR